ncbi:MAG: hypothetical protein FRX48_03375 [Lasallia pustulata]|uniref:Uncharacterized protein n=1 Tax=Lasallia pustulata TaxID=136370 RepID=A0A5M8PTQ3_9LECA|nr:MAG: hypothetical protein FRX48_03375 [Lasallia pustulata]
MAETSSCQQTGSGPIFPILVLATEAGHSGLTQLPIGREQPNQQRLEIEVGDRPQAWLPAPAPPAPAPALAQVADAPPAATKPSTAMTGRKGGRVSKVAAGDF